MADLTTLYGRAPALGEAGERVLAAYPPDLSAKAQQSLERLGVIVRTKTMVTDVAADHVMLKFGGAGRLAGLGGGDMRGMNDVEDREVTED